MITILNEKVRGMRCVAFGSTVRQKYNNRKSKRIEEPDRSVGRTQRKKKNIYNLSCETGDIIGEKTEKT
jgi:hypothetical protein